MSNDDLPVRWPGGDSPVARLIRDMSPDWSPLGAPDRWPAALRNLVDLILPSPAQIAVFWGPDYVAIYNDAYARTLGIKHPASLGRPAQALSPEVWHRIAPTFEVVRVGGESIGAAGMPFVIDRSGKLETLFFDFAWSPVRDDDGSIGGVLCIVNDVTEGVRSARALTASERKARESSVRLQLAQAAGGIGVFELDPVTDMLTVSAQFCNIFGVPGRETIPATEIEELVIEPRHPLSTREDRASGTARLDVEYRIRRRIDGATRWISRRTESGSGADGQSALTRGVVQDITARKEAEASLRQSEARFRALAQTLPNHVWTASGNGEVDWVNDSMVAYSGLSRADLVGGGWAQIVHPEDVARTAAVWRDALARGVPYEIEGRMRRHDGAWRWHLGRAHPVDRAAADAPMLWVGSNTDIEDQKAVQATLAERVAERTRDRDRLWQLSADIMVTVDQSGRIVSVNPAWQALLGWAEAQLVGQAFTQFLHPDEVDAVTAEVEQVVHRQQRQLRIEIRMRHQDGSFRSMSWNAVPDRLYVHGVGRDITALRESEGRLRPDSSYGRHCQ
jgi:PAS domain S-box-containing protein